MEKWKKVLKYEDRYEVSSLGEIRTIPRYGFHPKNKHGKPHLFKVRTKTIKQCLDKDGYPRVSLRDSSGRDKTVFVHRIVAEAFVVGSFSGAQVNHKNGVKTDNRTENLEWCTCQENIQHSHIFLERKSRAGENNSSSKLKDKDISKIFVLLKNGTYQKDIAREFGVSQTLISKIKLGKLWKNP